MATDILIKIGWALFTKFMTETFVSRVLVHGTRSIADRTTNKLDDKLVTDFADALGVTEK